MYLVCTYYLPYLYRMKKGDIKPATPQLLFCVRPVRAFLAPETRAAFAGTKTRGVQAQYSTIWPSDRAEIKEVHVNYLPLERFLRKWNSGCAAPGFRPPPDAANPGAPDRYFPLQKMSSPAVNRAV